MRSIVVACVVGVVCWNASALAQAPGELQPLARPAQPAPTKDPTMAVALSIGATAVGFALAEGGSPRAALAGGVTMFVGPSVGQWYAGSIGGIGLATRGVALLAILRGVAMSDDVADGDCLGLSSADCAAFERAQERETHEANVLIYGGLALWGASTIYDFVAAHRAATRWNREHALAIAPLVPTASSRATGVALALRF